MMKITGKIGILSLVVTMAGAVMFAGCNRNDDVSVNNAEKKSVFIRYVQSGIDTRSIDAPVGDGQEISVSHAAIIFYTGDGGLVTQVYPIEGTFGEVNEGVAYDLSDLKNGVLFDELPGSTGKVCIVGNTYIASAVGDPIATIQAEVANAEDQLNEGAINLYGESELTQIDDAAGNNDGEENDFSATVVLAPTVARFEIHNFKVGGHLASAKVKGIFMDDFYTSAAVNASLSNSVLKPHTTVPAHYAEQPATDAQYETNWNGPLFNIFEQEFDKNPAGPGSGNIWGYYVFAEKYPDGGNFNNWSGGSTVPRIIVEIADMQVDVNHTDFVLTPAEEGLPQDQKDAILAEKTALKDACLATYQDKGGYLTIYGYMTSTGTEVNSIYSGFVFALGTGVSGAQDAVIISEEDITPNPNMKEISVYLTVTPISWTQVPVDPILN